VGLRHDGDADSRPPRRSLSCGCQTGEGAKPMNNPHEMFEATDVIFTSLPDGAAKP
jgi:3-hydroxyisobutyrate dehydrogenase-like beta-hydroxyacid dehydrogenase